MTTQTIEEKKLETQNRLKEIETELEKLKTEAGEAYANGDLEVAMSHGASYQALVRERDKAQSYLQNADKQAAIEVGKLERDQLAERITTALSDNKRAIEQGIRQGYLQVIATRSSEDSGFDDLQISIGLSAANPLMDTFHQIMVECGANEVATAKRVRLLGDEVHVDPVAIKGKGTVATGRAGSNRRGRGWTNGDRVVPLDSVWQLHATPADVSDQENAVSNGAKNAVKIRVAKRHGYQMAEA